MFSKAKSDFQKILKSKNLKEMFDNVKYVHIEIIAVISMFLFLVSPVLEMVSNLKSNIIYGIEATYYENIKVANIVSEILGILCIILSAGKMILSGVKLKQFVKDNIAIVFFAVFILLMFISTCINGFTDIALNGEIYRHESIFNYVQYFCIYFFVSSFIKKEKIKKVTEYIFLISSMILSIVSIIDTNIVSLSDLLADGTGLSAVFYNSNHYGYYIAMSISLSGVLFVIEDNKILKCLSLINYIMNVYLIVFNNTFGSYLAGIFGMILNIIILYICNKKINILSVVMLLVLIAESLLVSDSIIENILALTNDLHKIADQNELVDNVGSHRGILWKTTLKAISERPLFGFGTEGIYDRLEATGACTRSHNEFLQYASFYGIPAGIMYICGLISVFLRGLKYKRTIDGYTIAALVTVFTYLVSSFFGNSFYYVTPFMFIFLGLGMADSEKKE